jgi:SAM-dependent methyltransferase
MKPADYHHWYETARGRWIGGIEFELIRRLLGWKPGDSILDVGCGTGYFTHRFAQSGAQLTGVDPNLEWIAFAAGKSSAHENYVTGRAEHLPFGDRSFDHSVSIAALCFMSDPRPGLAEMLRVTRRRFAVGLLNRRSTLYAGKGRDGGQGAYRGARWHTPEEVSAFFDKLPVAHLRILTAVFDARAGLLARAAERLLPNALPFGAFVVAGGELV